MKLEGVQKPPLLGHFWLPDIEGDFVWAIRRSPHRARFAIQSCLCHTSEQGIDLAPGLIEGFPHRLAHSFSWSLGLDAAINRALAVASSLRRSRMLGGRHSCTFLGGFFSAFASASCFCGASAPTPLR